MPGPSGMAPFFGQNEPNGRGVHGVSSAVVVGGQGKGAKPAQLLLPSFHHLMGAQTHEDPPPRAHILQGHSHVQHPAFAVGQCFGDSDAFDGFAGFKIKMGLPGGRFLGAAADTDGRALSHSRADGLKMQIIHGISSS